MGNLPQGWVESDLDTLTLRMTNGSNIQQFENSKEGIYPISRIETIWNETIDLNRVKYVNPSQEEIEKYGLQKGDVLFSHINSDKHLGKTALFDLDATMIHGVNLLLLRTSPQFNGSFLNYTLKHYRLSGKFIEVAQRSVNQSSINQKILKTFKIPLPPLAEQQRIVAKLDALFGHLETLKTRLDKVPLLLKNFRQAILTQAVTGKLTEEWRVGKDLEYIADTIDDKPFSIPDNWGFTNISEISNSLNYGSSSKSESIGEVPVLRMGNLQNGVIDWSDLKYSSNRKEIEKYLLKTGEVLFNRTNSPELVGKTSIYKGERPALYAGYLIKINTKELINSSYLNYVLNTDHAKKWCWEVKSDGVSQSNINAKKLGAFVLPLPSINEQIEIVRRIDSLFAKADAIEAQYQSLKDKINNLPQALLAKAFKGELVEQLPTDGDAKDLLEEIKRLKRDGVKVSKM